MDEDIRNAREARFLGKLRQTTKEKIARQPSFENKGELKFMLLRSRISSDLGPLSNLLDDAKEFGSTESAINKAEFFLKNFKVILKEEMWIYFIDVSISLIVKYLICTCISEVVFIQSASKTMRIVFSFCLFCLVKVGSAQCMVRWRLSKQALVKYKKILLRIRSFPKTRWSFAVKIPRTPTILEVYKYLVSIRRIQGIFGEPLVSTPLHGGNFSKAILAIGNTTRYVFVFKFLGSPKELRQPPLFLPDNEFETEEFARNQLFATRPEIEAFNSHRVSNDPRILAWNRKQLSVKEFPLFVGLTELVCVSELSEFITVHHAAPGFHLTDYLVEAEPHESIFVMSELGSRIAEFHINTHRAHFDLHSDNIFFDKTKNRFTIIDSHSLGYSAVLERDTRVLSLLMAFDREYFKHTLAHFLRNWESKIPNFSAFVSSCGIAFEESYKNRFHEINTKGSFTYHVGTVREDYK